MRIVKKDVKVYNFSFRRLKERADIKSLGMIIKDFFGKLGTWAKNFITKIGDKLANWIISLKNEQIKKLEEALEITIKENKENIKGLDRAAELVIDSEISMNKLGYQNKVLEDLAYVKMKETLEARHELEIIKKEKEFEAKIKLED